MTRPVALLVTFSAVFCLGCDAVQPDGRTPSTTSSDGPRLLTWEGPSDRSMEAIVSGKLRVNGAGCFTLDDNLLMAPPGSEVVREGAGIAVPGLGEFDIGETVRGDGGYLYLEEVDGGGSRCVDDNTSREVAVLSLP